MDSNIVRPFAQGTLLRRARRRDAAGKFTEGSAKWLRQRVNAAIDFLAFLDDRQASLETVDQALLDLYLAAGSTRRFVVRDFLRWAFERRLCIKLIVPLRQQLAPSQAFESDARCDLLRRLLYDNTIQSHVRVAGALALLYGQHLSRIVTWKTDQILVDESGVVRIRFADAEVELVEPLGGLLVDHVDPVRGKAVVGRVNSGQRWIFPGGTPGRHITSEGLRIELAELGVVLRPSRNSALAEFATDVPAAVLAKLLGLHINTAVRWTRSMQQDWQTFVAETNKQSKARPGT